MRFIFIFIVATILGLSGALAAPKFFGGISFTSNGNQVNYYIQEIYNDSNFQTTGSIRIQVYGTWTPYGGTGLLYGTFLYDNPSDLSPLYPGYAYYNLANTISFADSPSNYSYLVVFMAEWNGSSYVRTDYRNIPVSSFLQVYYLAPSITSHPSGATLNSGSTATLSVSADGTRPTYQWYKNGSPLAGATASSYIIQGAKSSDAGNYTVTVLNSAGSVTSNPATITVNTPPPPLSITSQPLATQILNSGSAATLNVTASETALTFQWYQGSKGDTSNPVGGNSSSFTTPSLATNSSYWVRVVDANMSVDSTEAVIVVVPHGIRVGDQFFADLSPLVTGGGTLKLLGKLPTGLSLNTKTWNIAGTLTGYAGNFTPSIQVIQNKALLQTISMPIAVGNFPTSLLGNYEALLRDQNGAPFGVFKLTTGENVWTATLETLGQAKRTAKGSFVLQQGANSASLEAKFAATKIAPAIALNFTLDGDSPTLVGVHDAGALEGFKMVDSLTSASMPILYNLVMNQGTLDALDKPAGNGWASGSFAKSGIGTFKGMLGDATACTFPLRLSLTGQAILWAQPYANKNSFIGGIVDLADLSPNTNNYGTLEPSVSWLKVADSKTLSYPGGFSFENVNVSGSNWLVPATHIALGNSLGWLGGEKCTVKIYGAGLSDESQQSAVVVNFPTEFTLDKTFKLIAPDNSAILKWTGSVAKGTGAFSGSFALPAGFATNTIAGSGTANGLLLQNEKWGITTGLGLIKVPIIGAKGSFRTAALTLEQ